MCPVLFNLLPKSSSNLSCSLWLPYSLLIHHVFALRGKLGSVPTFPSSPLASPYLHSFLRTQKHWRVFLTLPSDSDSWLQFPKWNHVTTPVIMFFLSSTLVWPSERYFGSFILEAVIFSHFIAVTYSAEHAGIGGRGRDVHTTPSHLKSTGH